MERGHAMYDPAVVRQPVVRQPVHHRTDFRAAIGAFSPFTYAIFRIGAGLMFMQHGMQKLFGAFGGFGGTPGATAPLMSQMGLAGVLELVGGAMIALGLLTRPVALILAVEMLFAYVTAHLPHGGWPIQNGGELALLYAFVFLFLFGHGAGPASIDRKLGHHSV